MATDVIVKSTNIAPAKPVVVKAALVEQITQLISSINGFREISTAADNEVAGLTLSHVTKLEKQIDSSRAAAKKPFLEMGRAVDSTAKEVLQPLGQAKDKLKGLLLDYRKTVEERNQAATEDNEGVVIQEAEGQTEHTAVYKTLSFEITGRIADIPFDYLLPDDKKIKAAVKAGILTNENAGSWLRVIEGERIQAR